MMSQNASTELAALFAARAQLLQGQLDVERTVREIVDLAVTTVEGADYAGVTLVHGTARVESHTSTSEVVTRLDALQDELGQGPCLEAMTEDAVFVVEDMTAERRWPAFCVRAAELGIRSMVGCRLAGERGTRGALNVHSTRAGVFDATAREIIAVYAAHAAVALSQATLVATLTAARDSRQVIGEATGILMERYRVTSPQAFDMLVRASQTTNVKLRVIARHVVDTGVSPGDLSAADMRP